MQIIDGRKIRDEILVEIKKEVTPLLFQPIFCDVLVGNDSSSLQYVKIKANTAEFVGIKFHKANFPSSITTEELISEIKVLNKIPNMCGIVVQLPLPESINRQLVLNAIDPVLDVDCLGRVASRKFYEVGVGLGFPAALSCMALLDSLNIDLKDKKIIVLGKGDLVGRPVAAILQGRGLNPFILDSKTENKEELIKEADVIISGIGKGKYLNGNMVKEGAVIIDAGTSESDAGIVGDVDLESMRGMNVYVSPVPGGVGPVTVAMLLKNVLQVAKELSQTQG